MKTKIIILTGSLFFLLGYFIFQALVFSDGKLHIVFCDVGQGDGMYVRTPGGSDVVIDAGRDVSILKCLEENMPFWDRTIELAFATHPDADHIAGFIYILDSYQIKSYNTVKFEKDTGVFEEIKRKLKAKNISTRFLTAGDTYRLDSISIKTLWPTQDFLKKEDTDSNRYSLVQHIEYGNFDALLTGDIDFDILNSLFTETESFEVFKLSHHGSRTGLDLQTLNLIFPQLAIISAGKNNSYGHPHKEVLDQLKKHKLRYLNTAKVGEIEVVTDGKTLKLID